MTLIDGRAPRHRRGRWLAGTLGTLAMWPLSATVLDPPREYQTRGELVATVTGPNCCGADTRFTGRFRAAYSVDSSGAVRVGGIWFGLDDRYVVVRGGFLGLFSQTMSVSCAAGSTLLPAAGHTDGGPERLKLLPGAIQLSGGFAEGRNADGSCSDHGITFTGSNAASASVIHQPDTDHVELHVNFSATLADGAIYVLHLDGDGHFENRPPVADLAFRYPDGTYAQDGCPTVLPHSNGQQLLWFTEANDPQGLVGSFVSHAGDPDGAWGHADIATDRWLAQRDAGPVVRLADGRDVGPFVFELGPAHTVQLLSFDYSGAADATACTFRVGDSTPPAVQAPATLVTTCTTTGGATPATSAPLAAFLAGATATDAVTPSPAALPPQVAGLDVTPTTLFPANNIARDVSFRFRDGAGNLGSAIGTVTVGDAVPPNLTLAVDRPLLSPDFRFWAMNVVPTMSDACGTPSLRLLSISSNAPAFDGADILGAATGTDDRAFFLFSRPAGPGVARVYTIRYEAKDAAGNTRQASVSVTVNASDAALGDVFAAFDAALQAPKCAAFGRSCDSGPTLLTGRNTLGPEPNLPNTIHGTCADGTSGSFHSDESNDRIKVSTADGTSFGAGKIVRVEAVVWAYSAFASDHLDLYYAANASSPAWTYLTTLTPTAAGPQILSATYTLPSGSLQAVRARFRYNGAASPCTTGAYDDHDDLIFAVR